MPCSEYPRWPEDLPFSRAVLNRHLRLSDVPADTDLWHPGGSEKSVLSLAASYDGYAFLGSDCIGLRNSVHEIYERMPHVLKLFNVSGLRLLLFAEYRSWRYLDDWAPAETSDFARELILELITRLM